MNQVDTSQIALSDRLRRARRHVGMSQQQLATALGVQRASVSQWECAGRALPNVLNLLRVATQTKVAFEWLATGRGAMKSANGEDIEAVVHGSFASSQEEEDLLAGFRRMTRRQREALMTMVQGMSGPMLPRK